MRCDVLRKLKSIEIIFDKKYFYTASKAIAI